MTKEEKVAFIRNLAEGMVNVIVEHIESGRVPDEWDGRELRRMLADESMAAALEFPMGKERTRAYRNQLWTRGM